MKKFLSKFISSPKDLWTIPNLLVYFRLVLVAVFCIIFFTPIRVGDMEIQRYIAAGIVLLAGFTDFLDGQIARRFNMVTDLGKAIDPTADKLMQLAIAICLSIVYHSYFTFFLMLGVFVVKEATLLIFDILLFRKGKRLAGAEWFGKLSTFVFYVVMGVLMLLPNLEGAAIYTATSITTAFLLISFFCYFPVLLKLWRDPSPEGMEGQDEEKKDQD